MNLKKYSKNALKDFGLNISKESIMLPKNIVEKREQYLYNKKINKAKSDFYKNYININNIPTYKGSERAIFPHGTSAFAGSGNDIDKIKKIHKNSNNKNFALSVSRPTEEIGDVGVYVSGNLRFGSNNDVGSKMGSELRYNFKDINSSNRYVKRDIYNKQREIIKDTKDFFNIESLIYNEGIITEPKIKGIFHNPDVELSKDIINFANDNNIPIIKLNKDAQIYDNLSRKMNDRFNTSYYDYSSKDFVNAINDLHEQALFYNEAYNNGVNVSNKNNINKLDEIKNNIRSIDKSKYDDNFSKVIDHYGNQLANEVYDEASFTNKIFNIDKNNYQKYVNEVKSYDGNSLLEKEYNYLKDKTTLSDINKKYKDFNPNRQEAALELSEKIKAGELTPEEANQFWQKRNKIEEKYQKEIQNIDNNGFDDIINARKGIVEKKIRNDAYYSNNGDIWDQASSSEKLLQAEKQQMESISQHNLSLQELSSPEKIEKQMAYLESQKRNKKHVENIDKKASINYDEINELLNGSHMSIINPNNRIKEEPKGDLVSIKHLETAEAGDNIGKNVKPSKTYKDYKDFIENKLSNEEDIGRAFNAFINNSLTTKNETLYPYLDEKNNIKFAISNDSKFQPTIEQQKTHNDLKSLFNNEEWRQKAINALEKEGYKLKDFNPDDYIDAFTFPKEMWEGFEDYKPINTEQEKSNKPNPEANTEKNQQNPFVENGKDYLSEEEGNKFSNLWDEREQLYKDYLDGKITKEEYVKREKEINEQIDKILYSDKSSSEQNSNTESNQQKPSTETEDYLSEEEIDKFSNLWDERDQLYKDYENGKITQEELTKRAKELNDQIDKILNKPSSEQNSNQEPYQDNNKPNDETSKNNPNNNENEESLGKPEDNPYIAKEGEDPYVVNDKDIWNTKSDKDTGFVGSEEKLALIERDKRYADEIEKNKESYEKAKEKSDIKKSIIEEDIETKKYEIDRTKEEIETFKDNIELANQEKERILTNDPELKDKANLDRVKEIDNEIKANKRSIERNKDKIKDNKIDIADLKTKKIYDNSSKKNERKEKSKLKQSKRDYNLRNEDWYIKKDIGYNQEQIKINEEKISEITQQKQDFIDMMDQMMNDEDVQRQLLDSPSLQEDFLTYYDDTINQFEEEIKKMQESITKSKKEENALKNLNKRKFSESEKINKKNPSKFIKTDGLNLAMSVFNGVSTYKESRREGRGVASSAVRAGADFAANEIFGLPYMFLSLVKEVPTLTVKGANALFEETRKMNSASHFNIFGDANFQDTEQLATMRQSGMELAKMSQYRLEQTLMGNEAKYLHR